MDLTYEWLEENLDGVKATTDGFMAVCPGHDDRGPSLHVTENDSGLVLHCFAGCSYGEIVEALESWEGPKKAPVILKSSGKATGSNLKGSAAEWWESYTGVPREFWGGLGVKFSSDGIIFTWEGLDTYKTRLQRTKQFSWSPEGASVPPLWPSVPERVSKIIWIIEGESDTGVARFLGLEAYGLTKGAAAGTSRKKRSLDFVWGELKARGAERIVFLMDSDEAGQKAADEYVQQAQVAGLFTYRVTLAKILDALRGEKDLRDLWRRVKKSDVADPHYAVREMLQDASSKAQSSLSHRRVSVGQFLASDVGEKPWIVKDILLSQAVQMYVGLPKLGKSWLGLDLCISVATGLPYLGQFEVVAPGPVVYIGKEDPDYLLHDRIAKIFISKGLGGSFENNRLSLPPENDVPFFLDLERDFLFTDPTSVASLMSWLDQIKQEYGWIAMVIFDPVLRMISGIDEFKASDIASSVFAISEKIRKDFGASVMLVHHRSKSGSAEGKGSYGSVAFHAFSDGTGYLLGDSPDEDGFVSVRQEFKSSKEHVWGYRFDELEDDYRVTVRTDVKIVNRSDNYRDVVLQVLARMSPRGMMLGQILEATSIPETSIRAILKSMKEEGLVRSEKEASDGRPGAKRDVWYAR